MLRDHAKFLGYMGLVQMVYRGKTFSTHVNNGEAHFSENIYMLGNTFLVHFYALFFTLDTICAEYKDKTIAS